MDTCSASSPLPEEVSEIPTHAPASEADSELSATRERSSFFSFEFSSEQNRELQALLQHCLFDGRPGHGTPVPQERQATLLTDFETWRQAALFEDCVSCSETATTASDSNDVGFLESDFSDEDA